MVAVVVDGAAAVVATVRTDRAVDKSDVFALSCELGLNLNLSLNFSREGIFYCDLPPKSRYMSFRSLGEAALRGKLIVIRIIVLNWAGLHGRINSQTKNQPGTPLVTGSQASRGSTVGK